MSARKKRILIGCLITFLVTFCCVIPGIFSRVNDPEPSSSVASLATDKPFKTPTPLLPTPTPAEVLTIIEAINQEKIVVQTEGAGLSAVRVIAERLESLSMEITIPIGTFFINQGYAQDMVSLQTTTLYLTQEDTAKVTVKAACANLHRSVPDESSAFDIIASPEQEELEDLLVAIEQGTHTSVVEQVAVWIVTDDVSRHGLDSRYVRSSTLFPFGGEPAASDEDVIRAIILVSEAGIPIGDKSIFAERVSLVRALVSTYPSTQSYAIESLGVAEEDIFSFLVSSLQEDTPEVRQAAAYALGKLGDQQAVDLLRGALLDDHPTVRREALDSLIQLEAVEALIEALSHPDEDIRRSAVRAVDDLNDPRALEPLISLLEDENNNIRQVTCFALKDLGDARAVQPLIEVLSDSDKYVRKAAVDALGEIGDPRAIEPLETLLKTEQDQDVIKSIESALRRLEG